MKATGIVRRIDDLGRVVIPKGDPQDHADPGGQTRWRSTRTRTGK